MSTQLRDLGLEFDPADYGLQTRAVKCPLCRRSFGNQWIFLRHRPEGRLAIEHGINTARECFSDRQLTKLGMWQGHAGIYWDDRRVSPLDEKPDLGKRKTRCS